MDDKKALATTQSTIEYSRTDDFQESYANNVFMESSVWDLKLIFGHTDQKVSPNAIIQNLAVTVPWPQVKVMMYFLQTHLLGQEIQNGRIQIPSNIIAPVPNEPSSEAVKQNPKLPEIHAAFKANYDAFIKANPEASPEFGKSKK